MFAGARSSQSDHPHGKSNKQGEDDCEGYDELAHWFSRLTPLNPFTRALATMSRPPV